MKILVIFTGGTIGSIESNGWIANDSKTNYTLLENYKDSSKDRETEFDTIEPYSILSENLSYKEINMLSEKVIEKIDCGYDGIIITHGTDSLHYTAAALSYMLSDCRIPVVLVSSDYPLSDDRANGNANFRAAVEFIKSGISGGVFVSYKNATDRNAMIHLGVRLSQYTEATANLRSIDGEHYAIYDGIIKKNPNFSEGVADVAVSRTELVPAPHIKVIESRPGDDFGYCLDGIKAVILRPYHSGTLNTESENFRVFCKKAEEKNVPVFLVNISAGVKYASSKLFDDLHIEVLPNCSFAAIYMKCWLSESLGADIRSFVKKPIAREFCE